MSDDIDARARKLAVELVDGILGYTMEFAGSPRAHRAEYDLVEENIAIDLREYGDARAKEAREKALREAAALCSREATERDRRYASRDPNDGNTIVQGHKSITARALSVSILALEKQP